MGDPSRPAQYTIAVPRVVRQRQQLPRRRIQLRHPLAGQRRARRARAFARRPGRSPARAAADAGATRTAARHDGAEHPRGDAAGGARGRRRAARRVRQRRRTQAASRRLETGRPGLRQPAVGLAGGDARGAGPQRRQLVRHRQRGGGRRRAGLPPRPPQFPAQRTPARTAAAAPADQRTAPAGSDDVEEGDPRDQPRAQQLAGAGGVAGALRRGTRPARQA